MKFLILENDIERQGLPDFLQDVLDINKVPYDVWWWFGEDVRQHPTECIERFSKISDDTFLMSYPSFVGYGNSFESKLFLFEKLMNCGIKIKIGLLYYPDFYWFLVKWLYQKPAYVGAQKKKDKEIEVLKKCLEFHEIYSIPFEESNINETPVMDCRKRITWDWLNENYFRDKSTVIVDGEKRKVGYVIINEHNPEKSTVQVIKELSSGSYTYEGIKLNVVKKV